MSLVFNKLKLKSKDKLLIVGIGGLGQVLIQGSKIFKPKSIYAVDINKNALKKAKKFGANYIFDFLNKSI